MAIVLGSVCATLLVLHLGTSSWTTAQIQSQDMHLDALHRQRAAIAQGVGEKDSEAHAACVIRQLGDEAAGNADVTTVALRNRLPLTRSDAENASVRTILR